ncbi:hypothetical protein SELMODRAFT_442586 [Selaginella moellendorffii]|uniref:Pyrrolo-quinoline quinone repeat domain-containing protein n=1 Tax=Selaginella moellendorffii TaxID=88036 RepID=D8RU77_SELML|nr:hypothetical protein SELMODRAFT_442586 [Selaginella moellendorffii]
MLIVLAQSLLQVESNCQTGEWISHGGDLKNRRFAEDEHLISVWRAPHLREKWSFDAGADISATPAIYDCVVYFPSWNGLVFAVTIHGELLWSTNLTEITGVATLSRTIPAVTEELLLYGLLGPARGVALHRKNGRMVWMSEDLDETPLARITMSGTTYDGAFYVVWGSSPSIDPKRGLAFIGTGNLYQIPSDVQDCLNRNANSSDCYPRGVCDDAVVAVNMPDGEIRWCNRLGGNDVWRLACDTNPPPANCPPEPGPDYDLGESPMLLTIPSRFSKNKFQDILVTGQKSGIVWAHDRDDGSLAWEKTAGPGGFVGGAIWGAATDNHRVYTNIANSDRATFQLVPSGGSTTAGGWVAMDAATGRIEWSTANPHSARAYEPVTVANGVVFCGSFDKDGHVLALDAESGRILWERTTGSTVYGRLSVGHECWFVGTGYSRDPLGAALGGTPGSELYAFCV